MSHFRVEGDRDVASAYETAVTGTVGRLQLSIRQGETFIQVLSVSFAQFTGLSAWHTVQGFGILSLSVSAGVMNLKVWLRTFTSASSCAIFGMWQPTHSFPGLPGLWCVCASMLGARGPFGECGP